MKNLFSVLLTLVILTSPFLIKAQTNEDSLLRVQAMADFDSLFNGWYVKTSLDTTQQKNIFSDEHDIYVSDSVIIERLKLIPTPIQLSYNDKVQKWIFLYLKKGKYMIPTYMGLSEYYFPMFEKELDAHNMPLELKYLPIIESALNPRAVSSAGATGIWQFIYSTGKRYNLEINSYVDERRDPQRATEAAVLYLEDAYAIFGDWTLALASYNCGAGNVRRAIARSGGKTDFWEIYQYLPRETRGYIPAFIAMTYIMNYTEEHNFYPADIDLPLNTDTVMVTDTLHLTQVAEVLDIPVEQLRDLNPQYKLDIIPGYVKPYSLRLPVDQIMAYLINEDKIYDYKDSILFATKLTIPTHTSQTNRTYRQSTYTPPPCPDYDNTGKGTVTYTVKSGDTFSFISEWFDCSVRDIKCWNGMSSNNLDVGQQLKIYKPLRKVSYYQSFNTMSFDQKQGKSSSRTTARQNLDPNFVYYTIKSGDNLYTIAQKFDGVTDSDIKSINSFSTSDVQHLQIGQVIRIKRK